MFHTILVPLDGSPFAEQALPWALNLAREAKARLDLVRMHAAVGLQDPTAGFMVFDSQLDAEAAQYEQLYLDGTARWLSAELRSPVTSAVVRGLDTDGILERIETMRADLVVMTTHGRGPISRFFLGSFADQVLRQATVPVLLIRPAEGPPAIRPERTSKKLLITLDGSPLAERVLEPAAELARLLQADCTLLLVIENGGDWPGVDQATADAKDYLEQIAERLRRKGLAIRTQVVDGRGAAEAILEQAPSFDLLALATHGRGGVRRLLLGSVADKLIRGCNLPVLVFRPPQQSASDNEFKP